MGAALIVCIWISLMASEVEHFPCMVPLTVPRLLHALLGTRVRIYYSEHISACLRLEAREICAESSRVQTCVSWAVQLLPLFSAARTAGCFLWPPSPRLSGKPPEFILSPVHACCSKCLGLCFSVSRGFLSHIYLFFPSLSLCVFVSLESILCQAACINFCNCSFIGISDVFLLIMEQVGRMFVIWVSLGNWRYLNTERLELSSHVLRAVLAVGQNEAWGATRAVWAAVWWW